MYYTTYIYTYIFRLGMHYSIYIYTYILCITYMHTFLCMYDTIYKVSCHPTYEYGVILSKLFVHTYVYMCEYICHTYEHTNIL